MKTLIIAFVIFLSIGLMGGQKQPSHPIIADNTLTKDVPAYCETLEQKAQLESMQRELLELNESQLMNDKKVDSISVQVEVKETVKALDNVYLNKHNE